MSQITANKHKIGKSTTTSNNFIIDASAADGTLKIERENGQQILSVDASGKVTLNQNVQTWQDVKSSRALNTLYTNSTALPIMVSVSAYGNSDTTQDTVVVFVGGVPIGVWNTSFSNGTVFQGSTIAFSFTVPAGATYQINTSAGSSTVNLWTELR